MVGGLCCYLTGPSFQWILLVWTFNIFFYLYWSGAHSSSDTSEAQCFAMFFRLNDMFPGNGVQRGLRYVFSYFVGKKCQPNQQQQINHVVLKRQLAQWVQVKSFPNVSAAARYTQQLNNTQYPTIESNHFYCHITTAHAPWWVKFLRACSRQCRNNLHIDSTYCKTYTEDNVQNTHTYTKYTQCTF